MKDRHDFPPSMPAATTIALAVLLWTAISALGALQTYSDNLRGGVDSHYPSLLATWFLEYAVPLIALSAGLSLALGRWPFLTERPRHVLMLFLGLVLVFQPAQWAWMAWMRGYLQIASLGDVWQLFRKMLLVGWFSASVRTLLVATPCSQSLASLALWLVPAMTALASAMRSSCQRAVPSMAPIRIRSAAKAPPRRAPILKSLNFICSLSKNNRKTVGSRCPVSIALQSAWLDQYSPAHVYVVRKHVNTSEK